MTMLPYPSSSGKWLRRFRHSHGVIPTAAGTFDAGEPLAPLDAPGYTRRPLTQRELAEWLHRRARELGHSVSHRSVVRWENHRVPKWVVELLRREVAPFTTPSGVVR